MREDGKMEEECGFDPVSGECVIWGLELEPEPQDGRFREAGGDLVWLDGFWYEVTRRVAWDDLVARCGQPVRIGLGPKGGFKWVLFADGSKWGHGQYRNDAKRWAGGTPTRVEKCDKDGNSKRVRARAVGRRGRRR